jgi:hypothetical protein
VTIWQRLFCRFALVVLFAKAGAFLQNNWFPETDLGIGSTLGFLLGLAAAVAWEELEKRYEKG